MNTIKTAASFALALLFAVIPASAGTASHKMPADYGRTYPAYEIRIASNPTAGHMLVLQVTSRQTGALVTNAYVTMQHVVWLGTKAVPQAQGAQVALETDGRGNYICPRQHLKPNEQIIVRAHVPGEPSATWTELALNN